MKGYEASAPLIFVLRLIHCVDSRRFTRTTLMVWYPLNNSTSFGAIYLTQYSAQEYVLFPVDAPA